VRKFSIPRAASTRHLEDRPEISQDLSGSDPNIPLVTIVCQTTIWRLHFLTAARSLKRPIRPFRASQKAIITGSAFIGKLKTQMLVDLNRDETEKVRTIEKHPQICVRLNF
jgi:hypothetical protein